MYESMIHLQIGNIKRIQHNHIECKYVCMGGGSGWVCVCGGSCIRIKRGQFYNFFPSGDNHRTGDVPSCPIAEIRAYRF